MGWPGASALHRACFDGDLTQVQKLVRSGSDINSLDRSFSSLLAPLHIAAFQGHLDIAAFLISRGAKVDIKSSYQTTLDTQVNYDLTPLVFAVQKNDLPMAGLLLEAGASPFAEYYSSYSDGSSLILHTVYSTADSQPMKELLERYRRTPDI